MVVSNSPCADSFVTLSDSGGSIVDLEGIDEEKLAWGKELKNVRLQRRWRRGLCPRGQRGGICHDRRRHAPAGPRLSGTTEQRDLACKSQIVAVEYVA